MACVDLYVRSHYKYIASLQVGFFGEAIYKVVPKSFHFAPGVGTAVYLYGSVVWRERIRLGVIGFAVFQGVDIRMDTA